MKTRMTIMCLVLLTVFTSTVAYSQIGIRGGVNLSKFVGADTENSENLMGLNAGISFSILQLGPVSIFPEVYYAEKGTRFTDQLRELQNPDPTQPVNPEEVDLDFNLAYVEIPVLAKVRLPFLSTRVVRTYVAGGPVFGFRLDCNISVTSNSIEQQIESCKEDNFSDLETTFNEADRGYVLVTGIDFQIPMLGIVTLDARYYRGLSRLIENNVNDDVFNQSFTLMLGYSFSL